MPKRYPFLTALALSAFFALPAAADPTVSMAAFHVTHETVTENGQDVVKKVYEPVTSTVPGERITYRIELGNDTEGPLEDVTLTLPIDPSTLVLPDSVTSASEGLHAEYATQSQSGFADFRDLYVERDGARVPASPEDLSRMQLRFDRVSPGETVSVEYDVDVK